MEEGEDSRTKYKIDNSNFKKQKQEEHKENFVKLKGDDAEGEEVRSPESHSPFLRHFFSCSSKIDVSRGQHCANFPFLIPSLTAARITDSKIMNGFEGLLPPDYGFKPQGKSAPMASTNPSSTSSRASGSFTGSYRIGPDSVFGAKINQKSQAFDEFGNIFRKSELRGGGNSSINVDSMTGSPSKSSSSIPVFDRPVYDDDIFGGVPGLKSSNGVKYDNIFASKKESSSGRFDDLLAGLGKKEDSLKVNGSKNTDFDDLLRGFRSRPSTQR